MLILTEILSKTTANVAFFLFFDQWGIDVTYSPDVAKTVVVKSNKYIRRNKAYFKRWLIFAYENDTQHQGNNIPKKYNYSRSFYNLKI